MKIHKKVSPLQPDCMAYLVDSLFWRYDNGDEALSGITLLIMFYWGKINDRNLFFISDLLKQPADLARQHFPAVFFD